MFEVGDNVTIRIDDVSDRGEGIGRADGIVVFVKNALPGDVCVCQISDKKKKFARAEAIEIAESSPDRIEPECPKRNACGGCCYNELAYNAQLRQKEKQVKNALRRLGGIAGPQVNEILGMVEPCEYRNKAVLHVCAESAEVGFFAAGTHDVMDTHICMLQRNEALAAAKGLRTYLEEIAESGTHKEKKSVAAIKNMTVRTSFSTGEVMVIFDVARAEKKPDENTLPDAERLVRIIESEITSVGSDLMSVYLDDGRDLYCLAGDNVICDRLGKLELEISPRSFYQVNPVMTEALYNIAKQYANSDKEKIVLDIYCGAGTIGLWMAQKSRYILGIESERQAILDANRNAVKNGIVNARYICGKAEKVLPELLDMTRKSKDNMPRKGAHRDEDEEPNRTACGQDGKNNGGPRPEEAACYDDEQELAQIASHANVAVLDPPRAGCKAELLEAVALAGPERIVYVSCDPATMARDIKRLIALGYRFVETTPVDMFPWTNNVESVSLLFKESIC